MLNNPFGSKPSLLIHKKEEVKPVEVIEVKAQEEKVIPPNESEHARILREHGGLESNIGIRHHYWKIRP